MGQSCVFKPTVKNNKGEEVNSKLFDDLLHFSSNDREFAKKYDAIFGLTSCFNGEGVKELFDEAAGKAIERGLMGEYTGNGLKKPDAQKKGCCSGGK